jgi:hypothetical protein
MDLRIALPDLLPEFPRELVSVPHLLLKQCVELAVHFLLFVRVGVCGREPGCKFLGFGGVSLRIYFQPVAIAVVVVVAVVVVNVIVLGRLHHKAGD